MEAQFRRGEYLFVENNFDASTEAFRAILAKENQAEGGEYSSEDSGFFSNARYMAGWSAFKNSQYENAIQFFLRLLDDYANGVEQDELIDNDIFENVYALGAKAFAQENKIAQDALRAISLSLAYAPVDETLASMQSQLGEKNYAHWVYAEIAELFFRQERLLDSARIYGEFERVKPDSILAPWFLNQKIATLQHSGFKDEAWQEKANFADRYHPALPYYQTFLTGKNAAQNYVDDRIGIYLDELASYHHAKGRALLANTKPMEEAVASLDQASYWYRQKISALPLDPEIATTYYLLAESLQEADHLPDAIKAYEYAAYGASSNKADSSDGIGSRDKQASEAGYAAIVVYTTYIGRLEEALQVNAQRADAQDAQAELSSWRNKKIESALLFSDQFLQDTRRNVVLANMVKDLQLQQRWAELIETADKLLVDVVDVENQRNVNEANVNQSTANMVEPKLALPTWLASAGAAFTLQQFSDAERRYASAINMMQSTDFYNAEQKRYLASMRRRELQATIENYASSIYSQAEEANKAGDKDKAIEQFQRLVVVAPTSQLRVAAQRDVIVLMAETEQWVSIQQAVPQFLSDFPNHRDKLDMQRRLLNANVQLKDWTAASALASTIASQLDLSSDSSSNGDAKRQEATDLRFVSADYALNSGDKQLAIIRYEELVRNSRVIDESLYEVHFRLASLYAEANRSDKELSQYRVIKQLEPSGAKRSERSLYIVAHAESELAQLEFDSYQRLKIQQPLRESLRKKQAALEVAIESYTLVANYAVEKYALLATQRQAQIYADFAKAIMSSDRPAGLDELALEEYEILLEEQAYPFEEQAIEIYEVNVKRAWQGSRSAAIRDSYKALAELMPARYQKLEILE